MVTGYIMNAMMVNTIEHTMMYIIAMAMMVSGLKAIMVLTIEIIKNIIAKAMVVITRT